MPSIPSLVQIASHDRRLCTDIFGSGKHAIRLDVGEGVSSRHHVRGRWWCGCRSQGSGGVILTAPPGDPEARISKTKNQARGEGG